jgi:hypothetical protein
MQLMAAPGVVVAGMTALVLMGSGGQARACSHPYFAIPSLVSPAPDSTGVPTNAVVAVYWNGFPGDGTTAGGAYLMGADLEPVPITEESGPTSGEFYDQSQLVRLRPVAPLQPGTTYQVFTTHGELSDPLLGTFTTGDGPSSDAPATPVVSLKIGAGYQCGNGGVAGNIVNCACESGPSLSQGIWPLQLLLDPAPAGVFYRVEEAGVVRTEGVSGASIRGVLPCAPFQGDGGGPFAPFELAPGGVHQLTVVAESVTGARSAPATVAIDDLCAAGVNDVGPGPDTLDAANGDAGAGPDATIEDGGRVPLAARGCQTAPGSPSDLALTVVLGLGALLLLRSLSGRRTVTRSAAPPRHVVNLYGYTSLAVAASPGRAMEAGQTSARYLETLGSPGRACRRR